MIVTRHQDKTQLYPNAILRLSTQIAKRYRNLPENWSILLELDIPVKMAQAEHMEVPYADD